MKKMILAVVSLGLLLGPVAAEQVKAQIKVPGMT